ncbi:MAG: hypothetical protein B6245_02445 [Desulfobacteraceae bacterium 4572_88]|nr:MAG: hypothetical protein B6245_02445 [Desulfobacteraceae bacterium 4572_88]
MHFRLSSEKIKGHKYFQFVLILFPHPKKLPNSRMQKTCQQRGEQAENIFSDRKNPLLLLCYSL